MKKRCGSKMCGGRQAGTLSKLLRKRHPNRKYPPDESGQRKNRRGRCRASRSNARDQVQFGGLSRSEVPEAERARLLFIRRWVQRNHKSYRILYSLKLKDTLSPTKFVGSLPNTARRKSNPGPNRGNPTFLEIPK